MHSIWPALALVAFYLGVYRVIVGLNDCARIEVDLEEHGATLMSIRWLPFGPGTFRRDLARSYEARFRDSKDRIRKAYCKTNARIGVYYGNERDDVWELPKSPSDGGDDTFVDIGGFDGDISTPF